MSHSCKHPLKAFKIGVNPRTGNDKLRVTSYDTDHVEFRPDGKYYNVKRSDITPFSKVFKDWQEIPCGQCKACRMRYSREWANRMLLEMKYFHENYFITLTYDDDNLPTEYIIHPETGEVDFPVHSLKKEDMQLFMKSLRYYCGECRFFGCGEYGTRYGRPHYHIICIGLHLNDLKLYKREYINGEVINYYNSETIDKAWKHKGFAVISEANWNTVAYTARYVTKKLKGTAAEFYEKYHLLPEFCNMSRKPGIGRKYFDEHSDTLFDSPTIICGTDRKTYQFNLPRYYKKLLDSIDEERYNQVKETNQKQAEISKKIKLQNTSQSYLDMLATEEIVLESKLKNLSRPLG